MTLSTSSNGSVRKWRRYPNHQATGLDWCSEIPAHWRLVALKRLADFQSGDGITSLQISPEGEFPVFGGNGLRGYTAQYSHEGDFILLGRQGALCGNVNYATGKFWASEHAVVVAPIKKVELRWLGELLRAMNLGRYSESAAQPGLSVQFVVNLEAPIPPVDEQRRIVAFLDRETVKIDELVAKKKRLIELLQEKRQALITTAVTKGLDSSVPMKCSGMDWLGDVPAHWRIAPLWTRYWLELGKMLDAKRITGDHLVPYLRNIDVQWDRVNVEELPQMDVKPNEYRRFILSNGDLLVCEGGEVGRAAIWKGELPVCAYQKAIHRLRPVRGDCARFLFYALRHAAATGVFVANGNPNTIPHLTGEQLRVYRFPFPPPEEQALIVAELDKQMKHFDELAHRIRDGIDQLCEYRTALISAAVTGKIDVRDYQPG